MSFALIEACKKRKRWPKFFRFNSFGDPGIPIVPLGTFRDNVRVFLQEAGEPEDYSVSGNPLWCTLLIHDKSNVMAPLYTVEEHVYHSSHPFCDHCRCVGSFPISISWVSSAFCFLKWGWLKFGFLSSFLKCYDCVLFLKRVSFFTVL